MASQTSLLLPLDEINLDQATASLYGINFVIHKLLPSNLFYYFWTALFSREVIWKSFKLFCSPSFIFQLFYIHIICLSWVKKQILQTRINFGDKFSLIFLPGKRFSTFKNIIWLVTINLYKLKKYGRKENSGNVLRTLCMDYNNSWTKTSP